MSRGRKNQRIYDEGIIDCCMDDPEEMVIFRLHENEIDVHAINDKNYAEFENRNDLI